MVFGVLAIAFGAIQLWQQDNATVPPRILKKRSIAFGAWFVACLGGSFFILIYYIPIWFQAIKGTSAVESGIRNLPMILGLVIVSIVSGIGITLIGYYTPFMIICKFFQYLFTPPRAMLEALIKILPMHTSIARTLIHELVESLCPVVV